MELAEERSLILDPEVCARAKADLTHPRNRLLAEMAWLPGVAAERCAALVLNHDLSGVALQGLSGLPPLARANAIATKLHAVTATPAKDLVVDWMNAAGEAYEQTQPHQVLDVINSDRAEAGIPKIQEIDQVEQVLADRRRHYVAAIRTALDKLPSRELVAAVTSAVERATERGRKHAPVILDQFVDLYEVEAKRFLDLEARNVTQVLEAIQLGAKVRDRAAVERHISRLRIVLKNWDAVAQPIQLSSMGRGTEHDESVRLAREIRDTAIELFNKHAQLWAAKAISALLREVFAEVPRIVEIIDQDIATLVRMSGPSNEALLAELMRQGKLR